MAGDLTFLTRPADIPDRPGHRPDRLAACAAAGVPPGAFPTETRADTIPASANRLRLLAELTPAVGHDIHNMLNVVVINAELARRQCRPAAAELFEAIGIAARNAADLTRTLMRLSSCQPVLAPGLLLDVNLRLQTLLPILDRILSPEIILHFQFANRRRCLVHAAAAEFDSAILNLVSNARDALQAAGTQGGQITVRTRNVSLRRPDGAAADHVLVTVADSGPGMDKTMLVRAWEPYFTTKGSGGTGLGLPQVQRFAEAAGGKVRIYSAPGRGTIVCLWLPRDGAEAEPCPTMTQGASPVGASPVGASPASASPAEAPVGV
jgi:signal transduction histidine kinase